MAFVNALQEFFEDDYHAYVAAWRRIVEECHETSQMEARRSDALIRTAHRVALQRVEADALSQLVPDARLDAGVMERCAVTCRLLETLVADVLHDDDAALERARRLPLIAVEAAARDWPQHIASKPLLTAAQQASGAFVPLGGHRHAACVVDFCAVVAQIGAFPLELRVLPRLATYIVIDFITKHVTHAVDVLIQVNIIVLFWFCHLKHSTINNIELFVKYFMD